VIILHFFILNYYYFFFFFLLIFGFIAFKIENLQLLNADPFLITFSTLPDAIPEIHFGTEDFFFISRNSNSFFTIKLLLSRSTSY
jgi:hypothetical protein